MLWPFLRDLFFSLARRSKPYALPLSVGPWMLGLALCVALGWILAWFSPSTLGYTGNARVALAAGVFHLWAVAAVALTAKQPPFLADSLRHPVVFVGAFWLLVGDGVALLFSATFGDSWTSIFAALGLLWALLFVFAFPRLAPKPRKEIFLFVAPFSGALYLVGLFALLSVLAFFEMEWILKTRDGPLMLVLGVIIFALFLGPVFLSVAFLNTFNGFSFYAPLLLTKGHSTPAEAGRLALAFALQRHPGLLSQAHTYIAPQEITLFASEDGIVRAVEPRFLKDLVQHQHGEAEAHAFTEALAAHLRRHVRIFHVDVYNASTDWKDRGKAIEIDLRAEVDACLRSKHAYLATIADLGVPPNPTLA